MLDFIHNDPEFKELLSIVSTQKGMDITLVEKDYWITHALYSLQQQGIEFSPRLVFSPSAYGGVRDAS
jgi:hypothetical protein